MTLTNRVRLFIAVLSAFVTLAAGLDQIQSGRDALGIFLLVLTTITWRRIIKMTHIL